MTAVVIGLCAVVALMLLLFVGLLRSHAEILRSLHDLGVNLEEEEDDATFALRAPSPAEPSEVDLRDRGITEAVRPTADAASLGAALDIVGMSADGEAAAIGVIETPMPTLLAFLSTGCVTCHEFWDAFASGVSLEFDGRPVRIVAVTKGAESESPGIVASLARSGFTTIMSDSAYADYGVPVAPYFVLVGAYGSTIVGEGAASTWPQLASLLDRAVADRAAAGAAGPLHTQRTRRAVLGGSARAQRVDDALDEAGIGPDHPSVHPR